MTGTPHCQNHCNGCGAHFKSVRAFDLHRSGSYQKGTRRCVAPDRVKKLVVATDVGVCNLLSSRQRNVTIWRESDES